MRLKSCLALIAAFSLSLGISEVGSQSAEVNSPGAGRLPHIIAHRGGSKWAPENTLAAFKMCVQSGVGIELDVQRCKSGELVVVHDENLERTTNGAGLVKDKTYSELKGLDAGSWFGQRFKNERIPLLSDVLAIVDGKVLLNIEIKNTPISYPGIEDDLLKVLDGYRYPETIIISSFDHQLLKRIHEKSKRYKLALLGDPIFCDIGDYSAKVGTKAWHPYYGSVRKDVVDAAHAASLEINVWTVDKPQDWKNMIALGVDGIVTDDPRGLAQFLRELQNRPQ